MWLGAGLMLFGMIIYVLSDDESLGPQTNGQGPIPAADTAAE